MPTEFGQAEHTRGVEKTTARMKIASSSAATLSHRAINATVFTTIARAMFAMDTMLVQRTTQLNMPRLDAYLTVVAPRLISMRMSAITAAAVGVAGNVMGIKLGGAGTMAMVGVFNGAPSARRRMRHRCTMLALIP